MTVLIEGDCFNRDDTEEKEVVEEEEDDEDEEEEEERILVAGEEEEVTPREGHRRYMLRINNGLLFKPLFPVEQNDLYVCKSFCASLTAAISSTTTTKREFFFTR